MRVPDANPPERDRVNAMNARLMSSDGRVRLMVDRVKAPRHCADLETVAMKKDGSGAIDKRDRGSTHWSDGLGYKVHKVAPVRVAMTRVRQM
jgi:hypothetical protein